MKKARTPYIRFPTRKSPMQTTFMDLIRELGQLTHNSHTVRLAHSLAPVRLVTAGENLKSYARRRR